MYVCFSLDGTSKERTIKGVINKTTIEDICIPILTKLDIQARLLKMQCYPIDFAKNIGYLRMVIEIQNI